MEVYTVSLFEIYRRAKKYLKGDGVYPDPEYAIKLFESCGDYKYAGYALGKIYLDGRYAAKDLVLSEKYLKNAAEHELDFAEYALGKLYLDDEVRRYDLAEEYLNRAAEHGNVFAMYRLAKPNDAEKMFAGLITYETEGRVVLCRSYRYR